jgi:hypothetical protein
VAALRTASISARSLITLLLALALALRLVGSAGYMPAFDHGSLTIIICPDADENAPLAIGAAHQHHHGKTRHQHNICPYAAASALGAIASDFLPLAALVALGLPMLLRERGFLFARRIIRHERPPLRGPPLPA